ncbi:MAG: Hpt domain-containing protein [Candidatus Omnitrophica bacterium]|nr:Hpt domain-containing protein [Candidatus Omnitrophota bacterium]
MDKKREIPVGQKIPVVIDREIQDLVPTFFENRRKDIERIREALIQNDFETVEILGHGMKGCGKGYGFDEVSGIGESLELAAEKKDKREVEECIQRLIGYLEHVEIVYQ